MRARQPALSARLSNLDAALEVQAEVEQINAQNKLLKVTETPADPVRLHQPKYPSVADSVPADVLARIQVLRQLHKLPPPRPAWKPPRQA